MPSGMDEAAKIAIGVLALSIGALFVVSFAVAWMFSRVTFPA